MRLPIPIKQLVILTHLSVFLFTGFFVGFATYSITKNYFSFRTTFPQISEKAEAEAQIQYIVYERREVIAKRPNELNKERITGYVKSIKDDETHIIYSYVDDPFDSRFQSTAPMANMLKSGDIFINGVSDLGFAVVDLMGNNLSFDYGFLKNRNFPLTNFLKAGNGDVIYTYGGPNSKEKDSRHKIYITNGHSTTPIDSNMFPQNELWLRPVGFSGKNGDSFYVERLSDVPTAAKLWSVSPPKIGDTADKKVRQINSVTGAENDSVKVCASQDYAVFISSPVDPTAGKFGTKLGPSNLVVSDLINDRAEKIISSDELLSDLMVACAGRKIIIKEGDSYHVVDFSGKKYPRPIFEEKPLFFSDDGSTAIFKKDNKSFALNMQSGKRSELGEDTFEGNELKVGYNVLGLSH